MKHGSNLFGEPVYVVDGCRTPFLKAKTWGNFSASDLAVAAGQALLNRQSFMPTAVDEVILGCVMPSTSEINIARLVALRLGCGNYVPAYTVMRNCASGMQAIDHGAMQIASGRSNLVLVGGTEAMSRAPVLYNKDMVHWLGCWSAAKTLAQKIKLLAALRPNFLKPVIGLLCGLHDPFINMNMGQTAEELVYQFNLTREQLDKFAYESHHKALLAQKEECMHEIIPIIDHSGKVYTQDEGIRADINMEKLSRLAPVFDKKYGVVTAGNSSQITDGACMLLLASATAVKDYKLPILGRIVDVQWSGLDPRIMGLGPVYAMTRILQRQKLNLHSLDSIEINEAFAAQVLACESALQNVDFCRNNLGLHHTLGEIETNKLNPHGGAIAIGHPIGASGARIVLHLLMTLKQQQGMCGMASICIGGGQGGAILVERKESVL